LVRRTIAGDASRFRQKGGAAAAIDASVKRNNSRPRVDRTGAAAAAAAIANVAAASVDASRMAVAWSGWAGAMQQPSHIKGGDHDISFPCESDLL